MADIWTVSDWSIGDAEPATFVAAFGRFADAATEDGGAYEGMILQDTDEPAHFVVVRRWESKQVVGAWGQEQHQHAGELASLVPQARSAAVMTKVADLGLGGMSAAAANKAATQAAYQAFAAGDLEGAMESMADDIEWVLPGESTISGTYRGKQEVVRLFTELAARAFQTQPQHFLADGDRVVVLTRITVDGQSADQADVVTFSGDGKVAKFQAAADTVLQERVWGKK